MLQLSKRSGDSWDHSECHRKWEHCRKIQFDSPAKFSSLNWHVSVMGERYDILFKSLLWLNTGGAISGTNPMGTVVLCVNMWLVIGAKKLWSEFKWLTGKQVGKGHLVLASSFTVNSLNMMEKKAKSISLPAVNNNNAVNMKVLGVQVMSRIHKIQP